MVDQTRKSLFPQLGTEKNFRNILFFRKRSHSAENPKGSSMLAKRFVSSKSRGGFDKNKLGKSRTVAKNGLKTKFGYSVLVHQSLKRKKIILQNLTMPKNVKEGRDPLGFLKIQFVAKYQKMKT